MPAWPNFLGGADPILGTGDTPSVIARGSDLVNWYPERTPTHAALRPTPGFIPWGTPAPVTTGDGGVRALLLVGGVRLFAVIGPGLWEFDYTGTPTRRGTVDTDGQPAQIITNGRGQLGIASAGSVYAFDLNTNALTGPSLTGGYTHLAYATSLGLALNGQTGKVNLSALNDLTTWNAGQYFQRALFGDPWKCLFVDQNNLVWLIGLDSFEVWYNTGQGTQPFAPLSGLNGAIGIVGPWAFAVGQAGNTWLARNQHGQGLLMETHGGPPAVLSTPALASAATLYSHLGGLSLSAVELLTHQFDAHVFTAVTFPTPGATWVYDHLEQIWGRRGVWTPATGRYGAWAPRTHTMAFGQHLVGSATTGQLAAMDEGYGTELDGRAIRRLRRAPALLQEHQRAPIDQLELVLDVGLAASGAPAPDVLLRVSDDGGRTWGNELRGSTGAAGAWRTRVVWPRLGLVEHAVLEVSYSDAVPVRLVEAWLNAREAA
jgi:hypothetical protein